MVFTPLADWKVRLLSMGMFGWRSKRFVGWLLSCWEEKWLDDKTDTTSHLISKTSSIVTGWSCHHCAISYHHHAIWWWVMHSNRYWISPSLSPGICQVSIMLFSSCDPFLLCFIILSPTLCHMPLSLLIFGLIPFPWWQFSFVFADSFVLITHLVS